VMPDLFGDLNELGQSVAMDNLPGVIQELCEQFPELKEGGRFCRSPVPGRRSHSRVPDILNTNGP